MGRTIRSETFVSDEVCIVHAVQRCVRRAYLAGVDAVTGKDFSFRREWIRRRLEALASIFGIDCLTYAIMSNHIHLVLRNRPDVVAQWSDEQVALRWLRVFPGKRLEEQLAEPTQNDVDALAGNADKMAVIRQRLADISWFMRALSEPIARLANKQDECTGRFWEGRFKAQRITDEAGLLACAMYVDLNPIKAAMAESPDQAIHTSAYDRIQAQRGMVIPSAAMDLAVISTEEAGKERRTKTPEQLRKERAAKRSRNRGKQIARDGWLAPVTLGARKTSLDPEPNREGVRASDKGFLTLDWEDYLRLLRWTAKQKFQHAKAIVPKSLSSVLAKMGIDAGMWRDLVWNYKRYFGRSSCAGKPQSLQSHAERVGKHHHHGQRLSHGCFV